MDCPYCGSDALLHMGFDDGGGNYGDSVCEQWECLECGAAVEGDCFEDEIIEDHGNDNDVTQQRLPGDFGERFDYS